MITEQEVLAAQKAWGQGIVKIGRTYIDQGDYRSAASDHIDRMYGYTLGDVFFKPTMASIKQFRTDREGALSYFIGGNPAYAEDHGFAIRPWVDVKWENVGIKIIGNVAMAMGNYYFTPANDDKAVKVEFSFVYTKDENGVLRIILHDSHLPFTPEH